MAVTDDPSLQAVHSVSCESIFFYLQRPTVLSWENIDGERAQNFLFFVHYGKT